MSAYRENAIPSAETLHDFPVSTRRGHALVVFLGVVAMLLLVAGGVAIFGGAPPEVKPWVTPMMVVGSVALVGAFVRHRYRRRRLTIVRTGEQIHLLIESEQVRLQFPLGISGDQMTNYVNRVPMYEVWLKLVDTNQRNAIFLSETRGAIYGPQADWLTGIDKAVAAVRFESGRVHMLGELREAVDTINSRTRKAG